MRSMLLLGVLLAAGCAHTAGELMADAPIYEVSTQHAPRDVANCVTRNAEAVKFGLIGVSPAVAAVRDGKSRGSYEVTVQTGGLMAAIVSVVPSAKGSRISVWKEGWIALPPGTDYGSVITRGC